MSAPVPPPPPVAPPYCSVVPDRRPEMKLHSGIGHAKNAVAGPMWAGGHREGTGHYCNGVRGGQVYELVDGAWKLLYDVPALSPQCELPWRKKEAPVAPVPDLISVATDSDDGLYVVVGPSRSAAWAALERMPGVGSEVAMHLNGLSTLDRSRMVAYALTTSEVLVGGLDGWSNSRVVVALTDDNTRRALTSTLKRLPATHTWHVLSGVR